MSYKVLVTDSLSEKGLAILRSCEEIELDLSLGLSPEDLTEKIKGYDAILIRSGTKLTEAILSSADNLKVIGRAGVGVDNVDVDFASYKGIIVMNAPSGNTLSTAELTISMLLALARKIPQANASMKAKKWDRKGFVGVELFGKTLGIVGFGRIGREVAQRMKSFGMKVLAYDPYASLNIANSLGVSLTTDLNDIYAESDFITLHTPLTKETKHLIDKESLSKMKKNVAIINCARGGLVDEEALADSIKSGHVTGAAFDAYSSEPLQADHPFYDLDSVIMTPHVGASTKEAQENVAIDVANQLVDMLVSKKIKNAVNYVQVAPEVFEKIEPFMGLATCLGTFLSYLKKGCYSHLKLSFFGELAELDVSCLTTNVIKSLLKPILHDSINDVNAHWMAKDRGLAVETEKKAHSESFSALMRVTLCCDDGSEISVAGTTFGKNNIRIVRIDEHHVDVEPNGYVLVCKNIDKPGFVGRIGTILGENDINIANMTLGRKEKGSHAVTVFNVDEIVSQEILEKISSLDDIVQVSFVNFEG
ncbi:phosphoglycerate dehydrogenase [PVC group bacterium (ex Bugula neritina AB1)]|nr:phosphoglycerate dehydrogenase [PVC group bacterium (ex Bugula neritina AB1)]